MSRYNPRRVQHPHGDEKRTRQEQLRSSDINTIVAQYQRSGTLPAVSSRQPLYGDFTLVGDELQDLTEQMQNAQDRFDELPATVRRAADNDWRQFLTMFDDDEQRQALLDAGLRISDSAAEPPPSEPDPAADPPADPPPS